MKESTQNGELLLELDNISFGRNGQTFFENFSWKIGKNENWAIIGPSGSGKSLLIQAILGEILIKQGKVAYFFSEKKQNSFSSREFIESISFSETSKAFNYSNFYYQQRFDATESQESITVQEYLGDTATNTGLIDLFKLGELLSREFIKLSNGQARKVRIIKALLKDPKLLILDEPFIGLDVDARNNLRDVFHQLKEMSIQLIMITNSKEIPDSITHILQLEYFQIKNIGEKEVVLKATEVPSTASSFDFDVEQWKKFANSSHFEIAAQFNRVNISYDEKRILKDIHWTIKKGEKWALLGPNGAGKTTLLSLINADNPQAYSQDILLFDRKRGSGESIWDIKKRIGFLSPELHLYFKSDMSCREVLSTGFMETLFLNRYLNEEENTLLNHVLQYLDLKYLKEKKFARISTGEQKLILFIRALIKNPPLVILDEPFQGMGEQLMNKCISLLNYYLSDNNNTMIFVTHNVLEIPKQVNHVFYLEEGVGRIK